MTPSRLSHLRDLWPHLSDIERELLEGVERLQIAFDGIVTLHDVNLRELEQARAWRKCKTHGDINGATQWGCPDCVAQLRRELEQAKDYLGRLLLAHYPQIHLLDNLLGVCTQIDNGLAVALTEAKECIRKLEITLTTGGTE